MPFLCVIWGLRAEAQLSPRTPPPPSVQEKLVELPVFERGLTLSQVYSCTVLNQLPWVFRKTRRQSRLIVRDKIRFSMHSDFHHWEVHQVMDHNGYVSYVFRRALPEGGFESIVTKEQYYNKILDRGGVKRITDVRNLTTLVDRAALTFYTQNNGQLVYQPGISGQARLQLTFSGGPPLLLRGRDCRRACVDGRDPFDTACADVSFEDDASQKDTPPAAGAAPSP
jgi:hypothetical protein